MKIKIYNLLYHYLKAMWKLGSEQKLYIGSLSYNLGKKLTKHLKQTREKLQIPLPPGQCWLNTVIYWCQAICR